jgi:hypothetical protein
MNKKYEPQSMTEVSMMKDAEKTSMREAVRKLGMYMMRYPGTIAEELAEDGMCAFEPAGDNHINKVFAVTSLDIDALPHSVKHLLTSHKPSDTIEE